MPKILYQSVSGSRTLMEHTPISLFMLVLRYLVILSVPLLTSFQSIYNIITTSQGKLKAVYPALLAVLNNVAAYLENLSASASSKLMQLFASMSSPSFLLANEGNHNLLQALLESMNAILEHQYNSKYSR